MKKKNDLWLVPLKEKATKTLEFNNITVLHLIFEDVLNDKAFLTFLCKPKHINSDIFINAVIYKTKEISYYQMIKIKEIF